MAQLVDFVTIIKSFLLLRDNVKKYKTFSITSCFLTNISTRMLSKLLAALRKNKFSIPFNDQLLKGGSLINNLGKRVGSSWKLGRLQYLDKIMQIQSRISPIFELFFSPFASFIKK
ncbi:hypothetical protein BpHYR1_026187 [Brachionus plicatilis]|uniref:Uncharacterized protein n=1 Tax=Brachionus plicatilis TaxID=10195 RepID=A0A3M7T8J2_BRAPC|nr:hypothetical protein BpHYR1_026187 [Brachionus plicatilis]